MLGDVSLIWKHFHEFFFSQFFSTIFLVKSNLSKVKKCETETFWQVYHPNFLENKTASKPSKPTIFYVP